MTEKICKNCKYFKRELNNEKYKYGECEKAAADEDVGLSKDSDEHVEKYGYDRAWHDRYDSIRYDENGISKMFKRSDSHITLSGYDGELYVGENFGCIHFKDKI